VPSSVELYPLIHAWLQALPAATAAHPAARRALAHLVTALLVGQSLRPSALMRALPSPLPVPARQRYKRVARAWTRPWLSPAWLTPRLVGAALALVAADGAGRPTAGLAHLALDSVHCGRWEVFTLGVVWHGRVLPVGWAVLPSPWPKGQFTPTVCALVRQVAAAWPAERPAHLVADRGFPSRALFGLLQELGWGWTIRLRAGNWVSLAGPPQRVRGLLEGARPDAWTSWPRARFTAGPHEPVGRLVIGRGLPVLPHHQRGPASLRVRADQYGRRQHHVAHKHPRQRPDASCQTDAWMVLFTSHPSWLAAVASYGRRWATEGSYRDAKTGWDGQHGWDLEQTVARLTDALAVERVVGLWALGALVQTWVGHRAGLADAPWPVPLIRGEWATTGRLSVWARGQLALTEPTGRLRPWLRETLADGAHRMTLGPLPVRPPGPRPARVPAAPHLAA
jgi:hypothetical protein